MASITDLVGSVTDLIASHPALKSELDLVLAQIQNLEAPEIAIQIDEGRVQNVERLNDAPFRIFVHDHAVDSSEEESSELMWNNGKAEPVIMTTYDHSNVFIKDEGPYWYSLRLQTAYRPLYDDEGLAA